MLPINNLLVRHVGLLLLGPVTPVVDNMFVVLSDKNLNPLNLNIFTIHIS